MAGQTMRVKRLEARVEQLEGQLEAHAEQIAALIMERPKPAKTTGAKSA